MEKRLCICPSTCFCWRTVNWIVTKSGIDGSCKQLHWLFSFYKHWYHRSIISQRSNWNGIEHYKFENTKNTHKNSLYSGDDWNFPALFYYEVWSIHIMLLTKIEVHITLLIQVLAAYHVSCFYWECKARGKHSTHKPCRPSLAWKST
jgi:hypothetical protein